IFNEEVQLGQSVMNIFKNPEEREFWVPVYNKAITGEITEIDVERSDRHFKFSFFPMLVKGALTGVTVISQEVTEKIKETSKLRETEKAAAENYHKLQTVINGISHSIWAVDRKYNYTIYNQKFINNVKSVFHIDLNITSNKNALYYVGQMDEKEQEYWKGLYERCLLGEQIDFEK